MSNTILAVRWQGSDAPLSHPAFKDAVQDGVGYVLEYPYWHPSLLKGREAQQRYCTNKRQHLRSWMGVRDIETIEVPKPPKPAGRR